MLNLYNDMYNSLRKHFNTFDAKNISDVYMNLEGYWVVMFADELGTENSNFKVCEGNRKSYFEGREFDIVSIDSAIKYFKILVEDIFNL